MFDFKYIMHYWKRMCDWYDAQFGENCCNKCPLREHNCGGIFETDPNEDWDDIVKKVDAWACVHPEPVYPTWGDWFAERGDLIKLWRNIRVCSGHGAGVIGFLYTTIPADIAQKLGIEPKESI